jgi:ribosomal protein L29
MKTKQLDEYKNKPVEELEKDLQFLRGRMNALKFDLASGKTKNLKEMREVRKNIAQLLTLLQSKN